MRIFDRKTGKEVTEGQEPALWPKVPPQRPPAPGPEKSPTDDRP